MLAAPLLAQEHASETDRAAIVSDRRQGAALDHITVDSVSKPSAKRAP